MSLCEQKTTNVINLIEYGEVQNQIVKHLNYQIVGIKYFLKDLLSFLLNSKDNLLMPSEIFVKIILFLWVLQIFIKKIKKLYLLKNEYIKNNTKQIKIYY